MNTKQKMVAIKYFIANRVGSVKESTHYEIALHRMEDIIKEIEELQIKLSDSDKKIEEYNRSISFNRGLVKDLESRQTQLEELSIQVHYLEEKKAEKGELKRRFMEIKDQKRTNETH